jgi:hypothetical protein
MSNISKSIDKPVAGAPVKGFSDDELALFKMLGLVTQVSPGAYRLTRQGEQVIDRIEATVTRTSYQITPVAKEALAQTK